MATLACVLAAGVVVISMEPFARADNPHVPSPPSTLASPPVGFVVQPVPPLSEERIAGELVVGVAVGLGGALVGALAGVLVGTAHGGELANVGGPAALGGIVGWSLAVPLGVYAIGNVGDQTGSYGSTYLWTLGGVAIGVASLVIAEELPLKYSSVEGRPSVRYARSGTLSHVLNGVGIVALLASPIVATVAFNRTRRYDARTVPVGSVVNVGENHVTLGLPVPLRIADTTGFSLASGSF